jgi:hypothetical protein
LEQLSSDTDKEELSSDTDEELSDADKEELDMLVGIEGRCCVY